jgi:hypothetical protein
VGVKMNGKIIDYILVGGGFMHLDNEVRIYIKKGYQPFGFPFSTEKDYFCQAVVKYEEVKS